jgi:hypothetical protein
MPYPSQGRWQRHGSTIIVDLGPFPPGGEAHRPESEAFEFEAAPVPSTTAQLPVGADSTRTGRNSGRPTSYPFILIRRTIRHGRQKSPRRPPGTQPNSVR